MNSFSIAVGRQLSQRRDPSETRRNIEYLADLPRTSVYNLESIECDEPVEQGIGYYYRGVINYTPKDGVSLDRLARQKKEIVDRVGKACRHRKWQRFGWHIEGEHGRSGQATPRSASTEAPPRPAPESWHVSVPLRQNSKLPSLPRESAVRDLVDRFKAISDPTRLKVLLVLQDGELNVSELMAVVGVESQPALSHHLGLMRHHLIEPRRAGKNVYYTLTDQGRELAGYATRMIG